MKYSTNYEKNCKFMRKCVTLDDSPKIKGFDFSKEFDLNEFLQSFGNTGFQASNLGYAVKIVNRMIEDKAKIVLCMSGNAVSSGLRDIVAYLVKNKLIHAVVTSAAGIEEDLIKCFKHFVVGSFDVPGNAMLDSGVGRIGNVFVPFDRYLYFEKFIDPFLEEIYKKQKELKRPLSALEFIKELGIKIGNKESYLYWAAKNDIPVFCPALFDGALGDLVYFFKQKHGDFCIDSAADSKALIDMCLNEDGKLGAVILGGGIAKHFLLNSCILREGLDYAVYLTTANEFDGSDSGGNPEEAKTWAKIKATAPNVKVKADFTITFPLLVAGTFCKTLKK